jgi:C4-dicarboxylate-specific signal transduction histidine kinase
MLIDPNRDGGDDDAAVPRLFSPGPSRDAGRKEMHMAVKNAALASNSLSATDLIQRLGWARENRDQHAKMLATLEGQVTQRRNDVERSLADLYPNERSKVVTRAVNGHRAELRRKSADARLALVREAGPTPR